MANPEHLAMIKQGPIVWNDWRKRNLDVSPDFRLAYLVNMNLQQMNLDRAIFRETDLSGSDFSNARLNGADIWLANLNNTKLESADLNGARFYESTLIDANLYNASLQRTDFERTNLKHASFARALISNTKFTQINLSEALHLESIIHDGPSEITFSTLYKSGGNIPEVFLRGCGVPETMITFAKSLVGKPIQYYSAFISYSSQDEMFARRLHNDLQMNGVRVWFAPEDLKTGDPLRQAIDESIRLYDKLIIVLSEDSIHSAWVRHEFAGALQKERQHQKLVLFPIRLDDAVFQTTEQWAFDLKERKIGDFREWINPLKYQAAFNRLLKDLNATS